MTNCSMCIYGDDGILEEVCDACMADTRDQILAELNERCIQHVADAANIFESMMGFDDMPDVVGWLERNDVVMARVRCGDLRKKEE